MEVNKNEMYQRIITEIKDNEHSINFNEKKIKSHQTTIKKLDITLSTLELVFENELENECPSLLNIIDTLKKLKILSQDSIKHRKNLIRRFRDKKNMFDFIKTKIDDKILEEEI